MEKQCCLRVLDKHTDPVYSVAFSPNAKYVASGSFDRSIYIYDLEVEFHLVFKLIEIKNFRPANLFSAIRDTTPMVAYLRSTGIIAAIGWLRRPVMEL